MRCGRGDGRCRAIARHLGRDRKTVRAYLSGKREPGQRRPAGPDRFAPYEPYCRIRFGDDPHLWAATLFDEVRDLGYEGAYPVVHAGAAQARAAAEVRCVRGGGGCRPSSR
jgi:transposase